jgi:uncharacterized protein YdaU (DUF1376 family)
MKADTWMPFYVGDYLRDTMHLTSQQHGVYLLLLMNYWVRGSALPDDDAYLAQVAKLMANEWQSHRQTLGEFFRIQGGYWFHKRVEMELEKAKRLKVARSEAGKKGAEATWNGKETAEPMANEGQGHVPSPSPVPVPSQSPSPENTLARKHAVFVKPSLEEIKLHASKVGLPEIEAEKFYNYYESNGWKVGRNPMKSWQAAMVNWRTNWQERNGAKSPETNQTQEMLEIPRL